MRNAGIAIVLLLLLAACSPEQVSKSLSHEIKVLETTIEAKEWKQAELHSNRLEDAFHKEKWKLQVLGEETEYRPMELEIRRLREAIRLHSENDAKLSLAAIQFYLKEICSL